MGTRNYGFTFAGDSVFSYVRRDAPRPSDSPLDDDFYVFVMGPYTAFDATYAYPDGDELEDAFIDDPLFDPKQHIDEEGKGNFELALKDLCEDLRDEFGVRAFIATDIDIPTEGDVDEDEKSMPVLDQSIAFAAVSDAVVFVFSDAGLTAGVGSEVGAILGEFHLRRENPEPIRKPRERFKIFETGDFGSASIEEVPSTYGIDTIEFTDQAELISDVQDFFANVERDDPDRAMHIFNPYEGY